MNSGQFKRLEQDFGVHGNCLLWFESYFSGRSQAVNINGTLSQPTPLAIGMPQGSVVGPNGFPAYTSPIFEIARRHGIQIHMYADDTQLFLPFQPEHFKPSMARLESCLAEIREWLSANHLKLNDEKTEFVMIGAKNLLGKISDEITLKIGDSVIPAAPVAKNIGAYLDREMNLNVHDQNVVRCAYIHLRNIGKIRKFITQDVAETLVHAFVSSRLDNLNSLLVGLPEKTLQKLQVVQNNAARLVLRKKRRDRATPLRKALHWLPINARVNYKVCLLSFKAMNGLAPSYLANLLTPYQPRRFLRSAHRNLLEEKPYNLKRTGGRSFSVQAPRLWNCLPDDTRNCTELNQFKTNLKTFLFKKSYD